MSCSDEHATLQQISIRDSLIHCITQVKRKIVAIFAKCHDLMNTQYTPAADKNSLASVEFIVPASLALLKAAVYDIIAVSTSTVDSPGIFTADIVASMLLDYMDLCYKLVELVIKDVVTELMMDVNVLWKEIARLATLTHCCSLTSNVTMEESSLKVWMIYKWLLNLLRRWFTIAVAVCILLVGFLYMVSTLALSSTGEADYLCPECFVLTKENVRGPLVTL